MAGHATLAFDGSARGDDLGLVRTGSSDYHGANKTIAIGQETTDPEQFEALLARADDASQRAGTRRTAP